MGDSAAQDKHEYGNNIFGPYSVAKRFQVKQLFLPYVILIRLVDGL
jgi:hypothetical protein